MTTSTRTRSGTTLGIVGALLLASGVSTYLALAKAPYRTDEPSHVGYTLRIGDGTLPSVSTPIPTDHGSDSFGASLDRPLAVPDVHVGNNPPFPYLAALPLTEISDRLGVRGGPLLGWRLLGVGGAVGAVGFGFLLGRELGGGDDFVGLVTAGVLSGVVAIHLVSALAALDGPALMATTAVTWALARLARTRTASHAAHLGLWCAVAAAVRPMALAYAAAAGLIGLVLCLRAHGWRSTLPYGARIGAPALVLTGWFYVLNVRRYGDPTGSDVLFEKFGMEPGPGFWEALWSPASVVQPLHYVITQVYGASPWWDRVGLAKWTVTIVSLGLVLVAVALAFRSRRTPPRAGGGPTLHPAAWVAVTILLPVPVALLVQHMSGGGGGHARYLLPMLPTIAAAAALVASRVHRLAAVGVVLVFVLAQLTRFRAAGIVRGQDGVDPVLTGPLGGELYRTASVVVAFGGAALLVAGLVWAARAGDGPEGGPHPSGADRSRASRGRGDDPTEISAHGRR